MWKEIRTELDDFVNFYNYVDMEKYGKKSVGLNITNEEVLEMIGEERALIQQ